jgi:RNA polymerase-binding transcription factor DksA
MEKDNFLKRIKESLEKSKKAIEAELQSFAEKDEKIKDNWKTRYPQFNRSLSGEEAADEVERYVNALPIEYSLELRLQDINSALNKIKKGKYGKCERCGRSIRKERLNVYPEAKFCSRCES